MIKLETRSRCKRFRVMTWLELVVMMIIGFAASDLRASSYQVVAGTKLKVKFATIISSGTLVKGQKIGIELIEPLQIGGSITLIEEGSIGEAEVIEVEKATRGGKPGSISVRFLSIRPTGPYSLDESAEGLIVLAPHPVDYGGTDVPVKVEGKGRKLLSYFFIAGLFIKGGEAVILPGDVYTVVVANDLMFRTP